jgi:hypothetical protein
MVVVADDRGEVTARGRWQLRAWANTRASAFLRQAGKGKAANAKRERIWFSPHTIKPDASPDLFSGVS